MAGLNFTMALWMLGPATLSAGASAEFAFAYPGPGTVSSFHALETSTAINQRFSYQTTGVVVHGVNEDTPPEDTTYFITVTNESDATGEFFFIFQAIYT
jgi:hypothetical protein